VHLYCEKREVPHIFLPPFSTLPHVYCVIHAKVNQRNAKGIDTMVRRRSGFLTGGDRGRAHLLSRTVPMRRSYSCSSTTCQRRSNASTGARKHEFRLSVTLERFFFDVDCELLQLISFP
jgi:hypothetical protein